MATLLEVPGEPVQTADQDCVFGAHVSHKLVPSIAEQCGGALDVAEYVLPADAVLLEDADLRLQVPLVPVALADPDVAIGYRAPGAHSARERPRP